MGKQAAVALYAENKSKLPVAFCMKCGARLEVWFEINNPKWEQEKTDDGLVVKLSATGRMLIEACEKCYPRKLVD